MRPSPQAPTLDSLKQQQAAAYGDVDASQARLDPAQRQGLIDQMRGRTDAMDMDEFLHPRANRTMGRMDIRFASCLRMAWANAKRAIRASNIVIPAQRLEAQIVTLENADRLGFAGIARLSALHAQAAQMAA